MISEYPRLTSLSFLTTCLQDNASRRGFLRLSRVLPTSRVFTSDYVNTETILHFFKIEYDNRQKLMKKTWIRGKEALQTFLRTTKGDNFVD